MQKLYDTPGVHLHHRQTAVVHSEDLASLAPQSRLRGLTFPVCSVQNCLRLIKSEVILTSSSLLLLEFSNIFRQYRGKCFDNKWPEWVFDILGRSC